jgi:hypothetical protein
MPKNTTVKIRALIKMKKTLTPEIIPKIMEIKNAPIAAIKPHLKLVTAAPSY